MSDFFSASEMTSAVASRAYNGIILTNSPEYKACEKYVLANRTKFSYSNKDFPCATKWELDAFTRQQIDDQITSCYMKHAANPSQTPRSSPHQEMFLPMPKGVQGQYYLPRTNTATNCKIGVYIGEKKTVMTRAEFKKKYGEHTSKIRTIYDYLGLGKDFTGDAGTGGGGGTGDGLSDILDSITGVLGEFGNPPYIYIIAAAGLVIVGVLVGRGLR